MKHFLDILVISLLVVHVTGQATCYTDADCIQGYEYCPAPCSGPNCGDRVCQHKGLTPFHFLEIMGVIIIAFLTTLANAGGIGGGSLLLPVISLMLKFHQNQSATISTTMVFVAAVTRFLTNFKKKHPTQNRVLIDYTVVAVVMPMGLLGTVLGVNLNVTLPEGIQVIILGIVFLYVAYNTFKKGCKLYKAETKAKQEKRIQMEERPYSMVDGAIINDDYGEFLIPKDKPDPRLERIYDNERTHCPLNKLLYVWVVFAMLLVTSLIPGPKEHPLVQVEQCGPTYWSLKAALVLVCLVVIVLVSRSTLKQERLKQELGYKFDKDDVRWTKRNIFFLAFFSLICGTIASTVGIGGGTLYNPLLLMIGVNPQVAAASGMYITLYNTASTMIQFIIIGRLPLVWSLFLAVFVISCSIVGILVINDYVKKSGRQSIIVFILGAFILGSGIVTPVFSFVTMTGSAYNLWGFGSIC